MLIQTAGQLIEGRPLYRIRPEQSVLRAAQLLETENIGALAVMEDDRLVGILSERDVVRRCVAREWPPATTIVQQIMTADPQTVGREAPLVVAMDLMQRRGFRHLPVVDDGHVYGMLSLRDIPGRYAVLHERFEAAFTELEDAVRLGTHNSVELPRE